MVKIVHISTQSKALMLNFSNALQVLLEIFILDLKLTKVIFDIYKYKFISKIIKVNLFLVFINN